MVGGREKKKKNRGTGPAEEEKNNVAEVGEKEDLLKRREPERYVDKKTIGKELMEIYKEEDGEMPDMSKIYRRKRSKVKVILVGLVVFFAFLAALSWAGFFFFNQNKSFTGERVDLEIETPSSAASGETVEYKIKYNNGEDVPLGQAEIAVKLPDNFVVDKTDPVTAEGGNSWQIGSLAAGESGEIKIDGVLRGEINSLAAIQAVMTYKPGDFNSEFQKVATGVTKLDQSVLDVWLSGPERILAKSETSFKVKYKNNSEADIDNVRIFVDSPDDFSFKEKKDDEEVSSWEFPKLAAGEEKEFEFKGSFGTTAEGEREFKVKIGLADGENFYVQKEDNFKTDVLTGAMLVTLIANGDSKDRTLGFGDTLNYSIVYQNKDKAEIGDVEIKMTFNSTSRNNKMLLDWTTLKDDKDGDIVGVQVTPELREGTITWTKKQIPTLAKLAPGAEGSIDFQIKLKPFSEFKDWDTKDFEVKSSATAKIGKMGGEAKEELIESNPIDLKINSDLSLAAAARYFNSDDIAVGSGPLPPEVGKTTAYRIFWEISNSLHEIENIKVSSVLPKNVVWSNKSDLQAGEIKFDEATREVSWTLNRMPVDVKNLGANFEVTITPAESDKGKLITLISGTKLQATDKSTGGTIAKSGGNLTTNLDGDISAAGKGVVK